MGNTLKLEDLLKPDCVPDESAGGENWQKTVKEWFLKIQ